MCKDVKLSLDNETISKLIDIYIKENMTKATYSKYMEEIDKNGFMIAASIAMRNEAIHKALEETIQNEEKLEV